MELLEKDEEYIISLLKQGKKVEAIIFVKDKKGMTLKEAKEYVDKKINNVNNECYKENISISKEDEEYISSLINENKKLQAVAFLHKNKNMTLLEARNYVNKLSFYKEKDMSDSNNYSINLDINNNSKFKENKLRKGYIFDKNLNNFVPYLARQKKTNKIIFYILLILVVISLIQLPFLDRTLYNQIFFLFSLAFIIPLFVIWIAVALNIYFTEKKLKGLEEFELTNEFEVKSLRKNFTVFFNILFFSFLIFVLYIQIKILLKHFSYKGLFSSTVLLVAMIYNFYVFFKELKNREYSLNINGKNIGILYKNNEINLIKMNSIDCVKFYSKKLGKGRKESNPTMQIFDKEQKILVEMTISIKDYYLLKKHFIKYDVKVADNFIIF